MIMALAFIALFFISNTIAVRSLQFIICVILLITYNYCYKLEYVPTGYLILGANNVRLFFSSNFYPVERRYCKIDNRWHYVDEDTRKVHLVTECGVIEYLHDCYSSYKSIYHINK